MKKSVTETIGEHVANALDVHGFGGDYDWDVGSMIGPEEQLVHFITIFGKSPLVGQTIQSGGMIIGGNAVNGEQIAEMVQRAIEHIEKERTESLTRELPKSLVTESMVIEGT